MTDFLSHIIGQREIPGPISLRLSVRWEGRVADRIWSIGRLGLRDAVKVSKEPPSNVGFAGQIGREIDSTLS